MALSWPVDAPVTQQFGSNPNSIQPNGHTGIDFGVPIGTSVHAAGAGKVVFADWASKLSGSNPWWIAPTFAGICVVIDHGNGFLTLYAHLNATDLNAGNTVAQGQHIGFSGSTGLSTGPHLHFEVLGWPLKPYNGFYGRLNPNLHVGGLANVPEVAKNQRVVGQYGAKERTAASTKSAEGKTYGHGDVLTFKGFIHGETVNGSDIWFVGAFSGTFFHSSAFDDAKTHDLSDLTPAKAPVTTGTTQRTVKADTVNYRKSPDTKSEIIQTFKKGDVLNFSHWTHGEKVDYTDIWLKGALSGGYVWVGALHEPNEKGLPEEKKATPAPKPTPVPVPVTPPVAEKYSFVKDFDFVEYLPAGVGNFQSGNFPAKPAKVVIHQFGTVGVDTINSTINTFSNPDGERKVSAHFVVSGKRIIQMVSLKDRAYHAGPVGNDYIGIETDPAQDADTIASTKKLLTALKAKYGYEITKTLHKDVPGNSTNCGASITLSKYDLTPAVVTPPVVVPPPVVVTPPPVVVTPPPVALNEEDVIDKFLQSLKEEYFRKS
jgi:hypothetical protein